MLACLHYYGACISIPKYGYIHGGGKVTINTLISYLVPHSGIHCSLVGDFQVVVLLRLLLSPCSSFRSIPCLALPCLACLPRDATQRNATQRNATRSCAIFLPLSSPLLFRSLPLLPIFLTPPQFRSNKEITDFLFPTLFSIFDLNFPPLSTLVDLFRTYLLLYLSVTPRADSSACRDSAVRSSSRICPCPPF